MSRPTPPPGMGLWLAVVRTHQRLGVAGLLGLVLLGAAGMLTAVGWQRQRAFERESAGRSRTTAVAEAPPTAAGSSAGELRPAPVRWPSAQDIPLVLSRIERAAVEQGLGWPQADYRFNAGTGEAPDSLEVRCALKGPYPSVRRFVTALLLDLPTLTLREFNLSRATADTASVDAKLSIVVYLGPSTGVSAEGAR